MKQNVPTGETFRKLKEAAEDLHNQNAEYRRASNLDFFIWMLVVLVLAFSIRGFIGEPILVDGDSMYPSLLDRERIVVQKLSYYIAPPERGDVIVCKYPGRTSNFVKRVVGLPGDVIEVRESCVFINGQRLDESAYWRDIMYDTMAPHTVQQGHVFVMGDNRNYSGDSRDRSVGDIAYEKILGRAVCVMWPLNRVRTIHHVDYVY